MENVHLGMDWLALEPMQQMSDEDLAVAILIMIALVVLHFAPGTVIAKTADIL